MRCIHLDKREGGDNIKTGKVYAKGMCQNSVLESVSQDYRPMIGQIQIGFLLLSGVLCVRCRPSCNTSGEDFISESAVN